VAVTQLRFWAEIIFQTIAPVEKLAYIPAYVLNQIKFASRVMSHKSTKI